MSFPRLPDWYCSHCGLTSPCGTCARSGTHKYNLAPIDFFQYPACNQGHSHSLLINCILTSPYCTRSGRVMSTYALAPGWSSSNVLPAIRSTVLRLVGSLDWSKRTQPLSIAATICKIHKWLPSLIQQIVTTYKHHEWLPSLHKQVITIFEETSHTHLRMNKPQQSSNKQLIIIFWPTCHEHLWTNKSQRPW